MNDYQNLVMYRNTEVDGFKPCEKGWLWVKSDDGAWDGPKDDWETANKEAYLRYLTKREVVVQAGGNCGMYPRLFAQYFQRVYTFEPDPLNFFCLAANCQKDNIIKMQATLGNQHGMTGVHRRDMNNVGMHVASLSAQGIIPMLRVDDLNLPTCDLMQFDTEGTEAAILEGAAETILKFRPVISLELPSYAANSLMAKYGYVSKGRIAHMDEIFIPEERK